MCQIMILMKCAASVISRNIESDPLNIKDAILSATHKVLSFYFISRCISQYNFNSFKPLTFFFSSSPKDSFNCFSDWKGGREGERDRGDRKTLI